jgi:non-heme chloroperoxidase
MGTIIAKDGTPIFYKDWGSGRPVVLSHGWPLNADSWDVQAMFLASRGFRVIAHDRRGHGRSGESWTGNDMNGFADDLAALFEQLDLKDAALFGFSMGGGEVARYVGRHGTKRVSALGLVAAVPPLMLKTAANPDGLPMEIFDGLRAKYLADRSQLFEDVSEKFFGANRHASRATQGMRVAFWLHGMQSSFKAAFDCIKAFSETDFTDDLKKFDVPTLIVHGDDDQIVPIKPSALAAAKIVKRSVLKVYPGAPHGLAATHAEQLNADLLEFMGAQ